MIGGAWAAGRAGADRLWGRASASVARGGYLNNAARGAWASPHGRRAIIGAGAGAGWGMMSSDTSVLGGAAMGAGVGYYGGFGARRFAHSRARGLGVGRSAGLAGRSMFSHARGNFRSGRRIVTNEGINAFTAMGL